MAQITVAILGASGYTGAELLRFLIHHPQVKIAALTGDSQAGQPIGDVFPHLAHLGLSDLVRVEDLDTSGIDLVFCCLPHGTTQEIIAGLPDNVRVVDLSADFRLFDLDAYAIWYGHPHQAPKLQEQAVYGLTEHQRDAIQTARLVANPGCYPTASLLPLIPLYQAGLLSDATAIIDAKSGVTGAGRAAKRNLIFSEVSEGMQPYAVGSHRHMPEIEQGLAQIGGADIAVSFTPHLIPMRRGMIATTYVSMAGDATLNDIRATLEKAYAGEPFVHVLPDGETPSTHAVRGSNHCQIGIFAGRGEKDVILISAIDNLVKGASGQAVQNMNVMFGWPEQTALDGVAVFP